MRISSSTRRLFADNGFRYGTICQHGNPVKKRVGYTSNRDFFRNEEIRSHYPNLVDMVANYSLYAVSKYRYGDYMKLPSEEQQKAAVHAMIFDVDKDYTEYIK